MQSFEVVRSQLKNKMKSPINESCLIWKLMRTIIRNSDLEWICS